MKASGLLCHQFWGDYSCSLILKFVSADCAAGALEVLTNFRQGQQSPDCLVACLNSDELGAFKERIKAWHLIIEPCGFSHCRHQCRDEEIDSIAHSIDYGPSFTLEVPAVPASQLKLALEAAAAGGKEPSL